MALVKTAIEELSNVTTDYLSTTITSGNGVTPLPQYVGYIGCFLAALFFGSNFIPVKKFETGDGESFTCQYIRRP